MIPLLRKMNYYSMLNNKIKKLYVLKLQNAKE